MPDPLKTQFPSAQSRLSDGKPIILYLALMAFFFTSAGYGGLLFLNKAQERARDELQEEVRLKQENIRPELLNEVGALEDRLKNVSALLANHVAATGALTLLEKTTHPNVRLTNLNFASAERKLDVSGEAASYGVLARQITFFEQQPDIERVEFGGLSIGPANTVNFKTSLVLAPSVIQFGAASP